MKKLDTVLKDTAYGAFPLVRMHGSRNAGMGVGLSPLRINVSWPIEGIFASLAYDLEFGGLCA